MTTTTCGFNGATSGAVTTTTQPELLNVTGFTHDTTHILRGAAAGLLPTAAGFNYATISVPSSVADIYLRMYIYTTATRSGQLTIATARTAGVYVAKVFLTAAGLIKIADGVGTVLATSTNAITVNSWNRIEVRVQATAYTARLYLGTNADGSTADETLSGTTTLANSDRGAFGDIDSNGSSLSVWFDDIGVSDSTWLGSTGGPTGSASFTAAGTLSTTGGVVTGGGPGAFTGTGTLSAVGAAGYVGTANFSGAGTLRGALGGTATMGGGTGTLAATGVPGFNGTAAFGGTGQLAVSQSIYGWTADTTQQCTIEVVCSGVLTVDVPVAAAPAGVSVGTWRYSKTTMPTPTLDSKQRPVGWVPS